jgi:hypothetical protein
MTIEQAVTTPLTTTAQRSEQANLMKLSRKQGRKYEC